MRFLQRVITTAACLTTALYISTAIAQAQTMQVPVGTTLPTAPSGAIPVTNPANAASAPTKGAQLVTGVTGATTAATPGALAGAGLPSIAQASPGNVAGLLSYCIRKDYVSGTTARSVARTLAERADVKHDENYSLGGQGLLQNATSKPFDIASLGQSARVKLCSELIKKGQSLSN